VNTEIADLLNVDEKPETRFLILVEPDLMYRHRWHLRCNSDFTTRRVITPMIAARIAQSYARYPQGKAFELYSLLLEHPTTACAAGWVFEARSHVVFRNGGKFQPSPIRPAGELEIDLKRRTDVITFEGKNLGVRLREKKGTKKFDRRLAGVYLGRSPSNQPSNQSAIDGIAVTIISGQPTAILFPITFAGKHPLGVLALSAVWNALPKEVKEVPPVIVFVVPSRESEGFMGQKIDGAAGRGGGFANPTNWPQYILALSDEVIFPSFQDIGPSLPC